MFLENTNRLALVDFNDDHISYKELINRIKYFSENLIELENNHFGLIIMENRAEWIYSFFGIWDKKSPVIALDALSNPDEILYVLEDSNPRFIMCSNETEENIKKSLENYSKNEDIKVINVDNYKIEENKMSIIGEKNVILENPEGDETAVMLYTSGTTGKPKGVMLTFNNLISEIEGVYEKGIFDHKDQVLAILPFHHILPLMGTVLLMFRKQTSVVLVKKVASKEILEALSKNDVTALIGVPRLYKLFYDGVMQQINSKFLTRIIYKIMTKIKSTSVKRKVFKKVHDKFGGKLKFIVSGGAKLDIEIAKFYETIGIACLEGYGLTETAPVIAVGSLKERKVGTVGKKLYNVDVKIVDEELWVKGPIVTKGYYNKDEKTKESITEDGWFKTGDVASIDEEGYITILGRKNTMIVLSNGKNIDPETLENKIIAESNYLIKEIGIFGKNDKLCGIIVPEMTEIRKRGITNIKTYIKNIIEDYNLKVHNYEKILDYKIYEEELPKTRVGKIRRFMLNDLYEKGEVKRKKVEEPNSQTYKMLKEYVKKLKGIEAQPEENLELEVGMDSLDIVEFFAYIENSFGVKINEEQFSQMNNLKSLTGYLEEKAIKMENVDIDWKKIIENVQSAGKTKNIIAKILKIFLDIPVRLYFRLKMIDRKKITEEPQIFVANHQSFVDALVLGSLLPNKILFNTMFLAIDWYFKGKILGKIFKNQNVILVDINNNIGKTVEEIASYIKAGKNILIFPEGARTKDGKVAEFKKVFAIIGKELNIDIQCLGIKGAYEAYSRHMRIPRPKKIEVAVLEKVSTKNKTYDEIVKESYNIIKKYVDKK